MELTITSVDYAPEELDAQVPLTIKLLREIEGDDRPDYWIGKSALPIRWIKDNQEQQIEYVVLAARWEGTKIGPGVECLPIGIAYVTDNSVLQDSRLDLKKCEYVAIGVACDTSGGRKASTLRKILAGTIGRAFGTGKNTD